MRITLPLTGKYCQRHGGTDPYMEKWYCDDCAVEGINKCKCGAFARGFSEALCSQIYCEKDCGENLLYIGYGPAKFLWNQGYRGHIDD